MQKKLPYFALKFTLFFAALPVVRADGIKCKEIPEQATHLTISSYLYENLSTNKTFAYAYDPHSTFIRYYVDQGAKLWVSETNRSLPQRLLRSEEESAIKAFKKLGDVILDRVK